MQRVYLKSLSDRELQEHQNHITAARASAESSLARFRVDNARDLEPVQFPRLVLSPALVTQRDRLRAELERLRSDEAPPRIADRHADVEALSRDVTDRLGRVAPVNEGISELEREIGRLSADKAARDLELSRQAVAIWQRIDAMAAASLLGIGHLAKCAVAFNSVEPFKRALSSGTGLRATPNAISRSARLSWTPKQGDFKLLLSALKLVGQQTRPASRT
jgi:hypothetical protein